MSFMSKIALAIALIAGITFVGIYSQQQEEGGYRRHRHGYHNRTERPYHNKYRRHYDDYEGRGIIAGTEDFALDTADEGVDLGEDAAEGAVEWTESLFGR